ncbi:hypothetical protein ACLOJK_026755 [Asimina triloba]
MMYASGSVIGVDRGRGRWPWPVMGRMLRLMRVTTVIVGMRLHRIGVASLLPSCCLAPIVPSSSLPSAAGRQPCHVVAAAAHGSGGAPNLVLPVVHEPLCSFSGI